jgi:hypothetical protein
VCVYIYIYIYIKIRRKVSLMSIPVSVTALVRITSTFATNLQKICLQAMPLSMMISKAHNVNYNNTRRLGSIAPVGKPPKCSRIPPTTLAEW